MQEYYFPYQVAETSEKAVGEHEFPSLFYLLGNGLVNIMSGERAERDKQNDASQPHFTACDRNMQIKTGCLFTTCTNFPCATQA